MSAPSRPARRRSSLGFAERELLLSTLDVRGLRNDAPPAADLDWPALLAVARAGNLLPALADRALAQPSWPLDPTTRVTLRIALEETAAHNTRLLSELARTSALLQAAGIEHVVLKGAVLLVEHYPRVTLRHTVDLDLLLDPARLQAGVAALRAAGYIDDPHYQETLVADGSSLAAAWPARAHACPPLKAPSGVTVDLHHSVPVSDFAQSGGFPGFLARSHASVVHGVRVPMCGPLDLAAHLCEHFALQHHADPLDAPRLLADLRALFAAGPPWQQLQTGAPARRLSVALAKVLYEAAFAAPARRTPITRLLRRIAIADPALYPWLAELSHLRGQASRFSYNARTRPRYALRTLFPTRAYMAQHYGADERSARLSALYLTRLLAMLLRPR